MRAINHSLTGALIGLTVSQPEIAIPLAFVSHFILDAIPHHGNKEDKKSYVTSKFIGLLIVDAILCIALVLVLSLSRPVHWLLAAICAFVAAAPDFFSFNHFYRSLKGLPWKPNLFTKFASRIQWFEKPIGVVVELVWLAGFIFCLSFFISH